MKLTLNRSFCLVSLTGHAIQFEKDIPVNVPACMVHEALAIGALADSGDEVKAEEIKVLTELDPTKRKGEIMRAFEIIVERASRNDFGANGRPHVKAVEKMVGYDITTAERDTLWDERTQASES